jgi:hypothetical protein
MTRRQQLLDLAARCEAGREEDRELDGWAFALLNPDKQTIVDHEPGRFPRKAIYGPIITIMEHVGGKDGADYIGAPAYSSSLDAAMQLVRGQEWCGGAPGLLREAMDRLYAVAFAGRVDPDAYREALARFFTAACLRAIAAGEDEG